MSKGIPSSGFRMSKKRKESLINGLPVINKEGVIMVPGPVESRFSIIERFNFVGDMVGMVADGHQASVVVTGPGGLGKSFTVYKALKSKGFADISLVDGFEIGEKAPQKSFRVIKGYSTPKGLYRTLYENRDSVIVFDDCDSVLKDSVSENLLKAALDSYSRRIISWNADFKDDDLPNVFEFKGRVVFISNMNSHQIGQPILSRSMNVDLSMTMDQKIERMRYLLDTSSDFLEDFSVQQKTDAMNLIAEVSHKVKELTLRTIIQVTNIRKNGGSNWRNMAEYAICG